MYIIVASQSDVGPCNKYSIHICNYTINKNMNMFISSPWVGTFDSGKKDNKNSFHLQIVFIYNSLTFIPLGFLFTAAVAGFWEESECGGVPQAVCWWSRCEDHRRNAQGLLFQLWKHRELRDHEGEEPDRQVSPENRRIWLSLFLLLIIIVNWSYWSWSYSWLKMN